MLTTAMFSSKAALAYSELRRLILTGELPPGVRLSQDELADSMDMSITPLREAIRQLGSEGLVVMAAHRDVRVSEVSADEARQLLQVRLALEPYATRLAAEHRTDESLSIMSTAAERLLPVNRQSGEEAIQAHRAFHRAVYVASGNRVMTRMLDEVWDKSDRYRRLGLSLPEGDSPRTRDLKQHHEILSVVTSGDGAGAERLARTHVEQSLAVTVLGTLDPPAK
ncbi:GntR family transcriptional regulator [Microbacterium sp. AK031]|uniref:GntR family transcriptional regulator n=1 Tax=Microbacterium sp. AK031 TaxID=2723076 RepID=UPI0021697679|nr:GntR family transcriptional regulator [Microbacterium sp. AK031]